MNKREVSAFKARLVALRARLTGEVRQLSDAAFNRSAESTQPNHLAELGSDVYEQDTTLRMLEKEEDVLLEIDEALRRVDEGTYGVCEMSGKPIPKARLNVIPWARYRVECARIAEQGG